MISGIYRTLTSSYLQVPKYTSRMLGDWHPPYTLQTCLSNLTVAVDGQSTIKSCKMNCAKYCLNVGCVEQ